MSEIEVEKKSFFERVDLVCAQIKEVQNHPEAEKLYILNLDDGTEQGRTIVSGLVKYYTTQELVGKVIVIVGNLKPAKFKGVKSEGMLLATDDVNNEDSCEVMFVAGEPGDRLCDKEDVVSHKTPFVIKKISIESFSHFDLQTVDSYVMIDKKDFVYLNGQKIKLQTKNGKIG